MEYILKGDYYQGNFTNPAQKDDTSSDESIVKYCPADTSHLLWESSIKYAHINPVIDSAIEGHKKWRIKSTEDRAHLLKKFRGEVEARKDEIAMAIALESGKPLWEATTEVNSVIGKVNVTLADSWDRIKNQVIPDILPNIDGHIQYRPIGPCLVIGPFNFPCHLANTQILAALLTGNSVIFKPSEKTMYSAQLLIECFHSAGFPKGVINLIQGTAKTTQDILKHPSIKAIYFTGSLEVGQKILQSIGTDVTKLVALELGGKNSTIVHHDAHMEHTLTELLSSCFLTAGQRCTSASIVAIHRNIMDEFISKFSELTKRILIGHPTKENFTPFMGPLIDELAVKKYQDACAMGLKNHAQEILPIGTPKTQFQGHYVSPTIHLLNDANKENPFTQIEIFGPNCTFIPYVEEEEAIRISNISDYGLAAGVFTQNKSFFKLCQRDIEAGIINLNRSTVGAHARLPFGGLKNSGNFHPAAVSMIDHTVATVSGLETLDNSSKISNVKGLRE